MLLYLKSKLVFSQDFLSNNIHANDSAGFFSPRTAQISMIHTAWRYEILIIFPWSEEKMVGTRNTNCWNIAGSVLIDNNW